MNTRFSRFWPLAVALAVGLAVAAPAAPLSFDGVSPTNAASQLGARYGVQIVLQNHFGPHVSFTVDDPDAPGARLQAVNAFANALGAEFTKFYVVRKAVGAEPSAGAIDSTAKLPAAAPRTLSAADAIRLVASLDDAKAKIIGDVEGTVTLPSSALPVAQAAAEVSQQTGTRWLTVYEFTTANRDTPTGGTIIGWTAAGSPILEYAAVYYPAPKPAASPPPAGDPPAALSADNAAPTQQQLLAQEQVLMQEQQQLLAQQQAFAQQQALARNGYAVSGGNGYGYGLNGSGYSGYTPYGNGYNGFGNSPAAMPYPANGLLLQGYGGY